MLVGKCVTIEIGVLIPRRISSTCSHRLMQCRHPISSHMSFAHLPSTSKSFVVGLDSVSIPKSLSDALSHGDWRQAMKEEMTTFEKNGTWDFISLPKGKKAIGCKWVYTVKMNPNGSVARLKACLVAKGYAQTYGVDYTDTFSPIAKLSSVRSLISLVATHHWPLFQLDVKNAFLHEDFFFLSAKIKLYIY